MSSKGKFRPKRPSTRVFLAASAVLAILGAFFAPMPVTAAFLPPAYGQDEGIFVSPDSAHIYKKIEAIELQLYGRAYPDQALSQRITRVERTLFSHRQPGVLEERYHRILTRMNEEHTSAAESEVTPMIEYLEKRLFQQTYAKMPLESRIRRLEGHVFGKTFEKYPMPVRLKKLTYAIPVTARDVRFSATEDATGKDPADRTPETVSLPPAALNPNIQKPGLVVASTRTLTADRTRTNDREPGEVVPMAGAGNSRVVTTRPVTPDSWQVSTGDYFHSIYKGSQGEVLRWRSLPVKVYLRNGSAENNLVFHKAISAWQQSFSVTPVNNSADADVIVDWQNVSSSVEPQTKPIIHMDNDRRIRTVVLVNMTGYARLSASEQLHGMTHQLGHAFGLWGHSENPDDVMYPAVRLESADVPIKWLRRSYGLVRAQGNVKPAGRPSQRDVNTLTKVYEESAVADLKNYSPY